MTAYRRFAGPMPSVMPALIAMAQVAMAQPGIKPRVVGTSPANGAAGVGLGIHPRAGPEHDPDEHDRIAAHRPAAAENDRRRPRAPGVQRYQYRQQGPHGGGVRVGIVREPFGHASSRCGGGALESIYVGIPPGGRREITAGRSFRNPSAIACPAYDSDSAFLAGYTRFNEPGDRIAENVLRAVKPGEKVIGSIHQLFPGADLAAARYFHFVSDKSFIGYSVSRSDDGTKLDGLMALARYLRPNIPRIQ